MNPDKAVENAVITVGILYPTAPWNIMVSLANLEANYVCFTWSNQPISCFNKELKYYLRHLTDCLSPVIIQQAKATQEIKNTIAPNKKNINISSVTF
jgi:hypothetical protein